MIGSAPIGRGVPHVLALAIALCLSGAARTAHGGESRQAAMAMHDFAIPPQPLKDALSLFARQTGLALLHPRIPYHAMSPGVRGEMTSREALARLLEGTGLEVAVTPHGPVGGFALRYARDRARSQGAR